MLAKRFFYVSAALFLLALTYHLGARSASAQAPANPVVAMEMNGTNNSYDHAITANGDVYSFRVAGGGFEPTYVGNTLGAPTATTPTTWGKVKADYRK